MFNLKTAGIPVLPVQNERPSTKDEACNFLEFERTDFLATVGVSAGLQTLPTTSRYTVLLRTFETSLGSMARKST